jgi:hypothetical protein
MKSLESFGKAVGSKTISDDAKELKKVKGIYIVPEDIP